MDLFQARVPGNAYYLTATAELPALSVERYQNWVERKNGQL
jgi:hypothetical protein